MGSDEVSQHLSAQPKHGRRSHAARLRNDAVQRGHVDRRRNILWNRWGSCERYGDDGSTVTHELGHYLGLHHLDLQYLELQYLTCNLHLQHLHLNHLHLHHLDVHHLVITNQQCAHDTYDFANKLTVWK